MGRVLFVSGMMMVSVNGIDPSGHVSSTVNSMAFSIEFMC